MLNLWTKDYHDMFWCIINFKEYNINISQETLAICFFYRFDVSSWKHCGHHILYCSTTTVCVLYLVRYSGYVNNNIVSSVIHKAILGTEGKPTLFAGHYTPHCACEGKVQIVIDQWQSCILNSGRLYCVCVCVCIDSYSTRSRWSSR